MSVIQNPPIEAMWHPSFTLPATSAKSMSPASIEYWTAFSFSPISDAMMLSIDEDSEEFKRSLNEFTIRIEKYAKDKLYPNLPDWPIFCFYSMAKRRGENNNWYALDHDERKKLMAAHGKVGRQWHGKIRQLITGSIGLDESEWGVTLFSKDTYDIKEIVYRMRFDEVTVKYGEFGDFYIGIQLPLDELFRPVTNNVVFFFYINLIQVKNFFQI